MMTALEKTPEQTFNELKGDLQNLVDATKDADLNGNKEIIVDKVYRLKAKATETIAFLEELEISSKDGLEAQPIQNLKGGTR
jgi:hypothetical protein